MKNSSAMLDAFYRRILKPFFFSLDAETAHRLTLSMLALTPPISLSPDPPELALKLWNLDFSNPVGLAAGMDKDAIAARAWESLGFGFAEIGTITPRPQPGNDSPRLWRLREHRALINRLGFPSEGAEAVAPRIERIRKNGIALRLALNFGPNKDTAVENVASDYATLTRKLGALADFIVVNVSSPNTPGLRTWQSPERMREIFSAMRSDADVSASRVPILIKLAPDLERDDIFRICDTALELSLDGIVACNTTIARESLGIDSPHPGGLSGAPLLTPARAIIRNIYMHTAGKIPIIGVGGITSADDAYGHICAGASLVELYTGLIYDGPGLVARIKTGLVRLLRRDGFRSISEAVGSEK
jgi:dihydroorotate dehydrogenase